MPFTRTRPPLTMAAGALKPQPSLHSGSHLGPRALQKRGPFAGPLSGPAYNKLCSAGPLSRPPGGVHFFDPAMFLSVFFRKKMCSSALSLLPWLELRSLSCVEARPQLQGLSAGDTFPASQLSMPPKARGLAAEIERLTAAHAATANALAATRAELRAERLRLTRARKRDDVVDPQVSASLWAVLMLLFFFSGYDTAAPAEYWELQRRSLRLPPLPAETLKEKVEAFFLHVPTAELVELADPAGVPQNILGRPLKDSEVFARRLPGLRRYARGRAASFLAKVRVRDWVQRANSTKGLAPRTAVVVEEYNGQRAAIPSPQLPLTLEHPATCSYSRLFVHRWRRMLKVKVGKIRVQDYISMQDKRDKAEGPGGRAPLFKGGGRGLSGFTNLACAGPSGLASLLLRPPRRVPSGSGIAPCCECCREPRRSCV